MEREEAHPYGGLQAVWGLRQKLHPFSFSGQVLPSNITDGRLKKAMGKQEKNQE